MPVTLSVQIRGAQLVRQGLQNLRSEIPRVGAEQIFNRLNIAKRRLQTPARPPDYPIRWDSERQRRAYFATRGFGGGIPHIRTGASELGWQLVRNPGSGLRVRAGYSLVNRTRGAGYIWGNAYGTQQ